MKTIFQVIEVTIRHPRRYPRFDVRQTQLRMSSSYEKAEEFLRDYSVTAEDIYAFYVRELPVDVTAAGPCCLSERVYDSRGRAINRREFSSVWDMPGYFEGVSQAMRISIGDFVEVLDHDEVHLGLVASVPPDKKQAAEINARLKKSGCPPMDVTDDSYTVYLEPDYRFHSHVDALRVFHPHFRIHGESRQALEDARQRMADEIMESRYDSAIPDGWEDGIYLVEKNGKKGAFCSRNLEEIIPCICDEMLERIDECGVIPFRVGDKWGLFSICGYQYVPAAFEKIIVGSEEYVKVLLGETWGWLDSFGVFTTDENDASIGSWYDVEK